MGLNSWNGTGPAVLAPPRKVIWYAGQLIAHGTIVIVAFEADSQEGHRLVTGFAPADAVLSGPGWQSDGPNSSESPWILNDAPAPVPRKSLVIGINASARGEHPYEDWVVQLASPDVTAMSWRAPAGWPAVDHEVDARARDGLAMAEVGHVSGAITLTGLSIGHRRVRKSLLVGVPGDPSSTVPDLMPPGLPPLSGDQQMEETGQGRGATNVNTDRTLLTGICYGPSPMMFSAQAAGTGSDTRIGKIRCNDRPHTLAWTGASAFISWDTSPLTAWNFKTADTSTAR
ncbi:MAG TPA: hypothetical protein VMA72_10290 [Streptosporangiaceae bacterium]|nr:hypothetical protein [Streptosporangiaceae bacterium]